MGRIGDMILLTPVFKSLKALNLDNEIHVLAGKHNYLVAERHPFIEKVYIYKKNPLSDLNLIRNLRKEQYDYWIDVKDHYSSESYYFAKLSNARIKVGFNAPGKCVFHHSLPAHTEQRDKHVVQRNMAAVSPLGLITPPLSQLRPTLYTDSQADEKLHTFLQQHSISRYACINISATSPRRYWTTEKWTAFCRFLQHHQTPCLLVSAPADNPMVQDIVDATANAHAFPTASIIEVFSVVKRAQIVISPDTSVVHIAAAFDIPIVALFWNNPNNIIKFKPLSTRSRLVTLPERGGAVADIAVDDVTESYISLINELKTPKHGNRKKFIDFTPIKRCV